MAYSELTKMGAFGVCQHVGTPNFYVSAYLPDRKTMVYRSLHTTDLADAIVIVRDLVDRGIAGDPIDALAKKPLRTVLDVLEFYRPAFEAQASAEFNGIAAKRMIRLMGDRPLQVMVKSDFDGFRDKAMAEGIALSTVHRTLTLLRSACQEAVAERRLPRHHVPRIPFYMTKNHVRAAPPKGRPMSPPEIARAIDKLEFIHLLVGAVWLANTATRIGAIVDATPAQIEHEFGLIHLNPKGRVQTSKYRPTLPIPDTLLPWTQDLPAGYIVQWRGEKVGEIDTGFEAACRRADLPGDENTYSIRHGAGRFMRAQGVPDQQVSLWLGHIQPENSIETTIVYSPYSPDYLREAKAAMENFVREIARHCRHHDVLTPPWRK